VLPVPSPNEQLQNADLCDTNSQAEKSLLEEVLDSENALRRELNQGRKGELSQIGDQLKELKAEFSKDLGASESALMAAMDVVVQDLSDDLKLLKNEVFKEMATKEFALRNELGLIEKDVADDLKILREELSKEIDASENALRNELTVIESDVTTMQSELSVTANDIKAGIARLQRQSDKQMRHMEGGGATSKFKTTARRCFLTHCIVEGNVYPMAGIEKRSPEVAPNTPTRGDMPLRPAQRKDSGTIIDSTAFTTQSEMIDTARKAHVDTDEEGLAQSDLESTRQNDAPVVSTAKSSEVYLLQEQIDAEIPPSISNSRQRDGYPPLPTPIPAPKSFPPDFVFPTSCFYVS